MGLPTNVRFVCSLFIKQGEQWSMMQSLGYCKLGGKKKRKKTCMMGYCWSIGEWWKLSLVLSRHKHQKWTTVILGGAQMVQVPSFNWSGNHFKKQTYNFAACKMDPDFKYFFLPHRISVGKETHVWWAASFRVNTVCYVLLLLHCLLKSCNHTMLLCVMLKRFISDTFALLISWCRFFYCQIWKTSAREMRRSQWLHAVRDWLIDFHPIQQSGFCGTARQASCSGRCLFVKGT